MQTRTKADTPPLLLAIVELGGYPNFSALYQDIGFRVVQERSMRRVLTLLKKNDPRVIVAEFNFQSDFRDRTSSLESLLAVVQRKRDCRVIVFYEQEFAHQLERLLARFTVFATMTYPIDSVLLTRNLQRALTDAGEIAADKQEG